jgi:hypothetical protein
MTTNHFDDQYVRAKAVEYVRGTLQKGKTLAAMLVKYIDFLQGTVVALTPVPLSAKETPEFDRGHLPSNQDSRLRITVGDLSGAAYPKSNANEQLVDLIEQSLGLQKDICLLENSLAAPKDPWLNRAHSRIAIYDNEVYHVLTSGDRSKNSISAAVREAHAPTVLVGALGREVLNCPASRRFDVSKEDLRKFAQLSQCVFVSAYDGEGYIVWSDGTPGRT